MERSTNLNDFLLVIPCCAVALLALVVVGVVFFIANGAARNQGEG